MHLFTTWTDLEEVVMAVMVILLCFLAVLVSNPGLCACGKCSVSEQNSQTCLVSKCKFWFACLPAQQPPSRDAFEFKWAWCGFIPGFGCSRLKDVPSVCIVVSLSVFPVTFLPVYVSPLIKVTAAATVFPLLISCGFLLLSVWRVGVCLNLAVLHRDTTTVSNKQNWSLET